MVVVYYTMYNRLSGQHTLSSFLCHTNTKYKDTQIQNTHIQLINERFQAHIVSILVSAATPLGISLLRATLLCFFRAASFTCHNPCHATVPLWLCHLSFVRIKVTGCKKVANVNLEHSENVILWAKPAS